MRKQLEKTVKKFVIASIDVEGKTVYLRSLHNHKWEIVTNIELATKAYARDIADTVLRNYMEDFQTNTEFVVIPLTIEYYLVDES